MKKMSVNSLVIIGLCIAFSMVLSFIESQLPPFIAAYGIKIAMVNTAWFSLSTKWAGSKRY